MLPALLETLQFRSDDRFQPLIEALAVIQRHLGSHHRYFPETVPVEGVVTPAWKEKVVEEVRADLAGDGNQRGQAVAATHSGGRIALTSADRDFIASHRTDSNRIGVAVQL
jgi:hypothetical protein